MADLCKVTIKYSVYSPSYTSTCTSLPKKKYWLKENFTKFYAQFRQIREISNFTKVFENAVSIHSTASAEADAEQNTDSLEFLLGRL